MSDFAVSLPLSHVDIIQQWALQPNAPAETRPTPRNCCNCMHKQSRTVLQGLPISFCAGPEAGPPPGTPP